MQDLMKMVKVYINMLLSILAILITLQGVVIFSYLTVRFVVDEKEKTPIRALVCYLTSIFLIFLCSASIWTLIGRL